MPKLQYLLDTSVYSQPLRKVPLPSVIKRWSALDELTFATSVICEAELHIGLIKKNSERLWSGYKNLIQGRYPLLNVDRDVASEFARLSAEWSAKGQARPDMDLLIAATAKVHGLTVATCNFRHFSGIAGLRAEDWSRA